MEKFKAIFRSKIFLAMAILFIVSGLSYLIWLPKFGYLNDDWYLMYAAGAKGAAVFRDIFSIDRPGRVLVMRPAYWLFGQNPLHYNLSAYIFRLASGIGLYWLVTLLWPRRHAAAISAAVLFLIYPGFLSQPNAIDYQSHIVALACAIFSIALSVQAVLSTNVYKRSLSFLLAIVLGWFSLWQMEWYIGFEFMRWGSIFILVSRTGGSFAQKCMQALRRAYVLLLVPVVFLFWRITVFKPERGATDISLQLDQVIQSPLTTGLRWLVTWLTDSLEVVVLAWGQPLSSLLPWIWIRSLLLSGLGVGIVSVAIVYFGLRQVEGPEGSEEGHWQSEALTLGLASVLAGLLPIVLVNRYVDFMYYSRYTLVSAAGAAILLVAFIYSIRHSNWQKAMIAILVFSATLTHFANSQRIVQITQATRNFWWQVSWRIPQLERNTTLVANYAVGATEEDYFVWGPANLIYYPQGTHEEHVQPGVYAALLNQTTLNKTLLNKGQEYDNRRTIRTYKNYRRLLVLSQPTLNSCVHLIDGAQPEYSGSENASVRVIGPFSSFEHILANEPAPTPPAVVFGPEPEHGWCYFYQKASLARQQEAWDEIQALGEQAAARNLFPADPIEWMPFLQAYALQGNIEQLERLAPTVITDAFVTQQACRMFGELPDLPQEVLDAIDLSYCVD